MNMHFKEIKIKYYEIPVDSMENRINTFISRERDLTEYLQFYNITFTAFNFFLNFFIINKPFWMW